MDLFGHIVDLLKSGKTKDSAEIVALLKLLESNPQAHADAMTLIASWPPKPTLADRLPERNTILLGGAGIAGISSLALVPGILEFVKKNAPFDQVPVHSVWLLLLIIAALGALAGAVYSVYHHRGIAWPRFSKRVATRPEESDVLTLTEYGFLNEIFFGALAAITTVWLASVGLVPATNSGLGQTTTTESKSVDKSAAVKKADLERVSLDAKLKTIQHEISANALKAAQDELALIKADTNRAAEVAAAELKVTNAKAAEADAGKALDSANQEVSRLKSESSDPSNLLGTSVILSALVSGWYGARMRTFNLDRHLLKDALAITAVSEKQSPIMREAIRTAPNTVAAVELATGMTVVGGATTKPPATPPVAPPAQDAQDPGQPPAPPEVQIVQPGVLTVQPEAEGKLLELLDAAQLRTAIAAGSGPLTRDGSWLTLKMLNIFAELRKVDAGIDAVAEMKLMPVAGQTEDHFAATAVAPAVATPLMNLQLRNIYPKARAVGALLVSMPQTWQLPTPA